uniref:Putative ovule protein n=1 Tax=Solanum chacoense TaxID=4108 RepID=A0A0V0HD52_SOLCH
MQNFVKNPFSQRSSMVVPEANDVPQHAVLVHSQETHQASSLVHQQMPLVPQLAQQLALLQAAAGAYGVPQHAPLVHSQEIHQASILCISRCPLCYNWPNSLHCFRKLQGLMEMIIDHLH